jgi:general secretion pathway protein D
MGGGFPQGGNRGGNNRFGGFQGRGGFGGFGGFGGRPGGQGSGVVRASADDFSNSVIVNAPTREQGQVQELIRQIDKPAEAPQTTKVYPLEFATANEIAPVIQNVLTSNAPTGRGGIGSQNIPIEQRFQQAVRLGSAQASFGTVAADARTNSVVVTATEDNHKIVAEVVKELDKEVKYEASTFVFPLANARADQMAQLLQQAFGTRQGTNNRSNVGTGFNRTNQNNNNNRNRTNPFGGGGGNPLRGQIVDDGRNLELELEQAEADAGELFTMVGVAQGGGFGGLFGGQQNRQSSQTQGRTQDGRLVNVRDLTGQVTVIPDQNTNSLVVVSTPENADLIRSILEQLDKIPEQVMIETIIVEATLDSSMKLGVEWSFAQNKVFGDPAKSGNANTNFGLQNSQSPAEGFRYTLTGGDLSGFLNALKSDRKFQVLSTPRIFTSNNVEAQINISQSVPYVLSTREDQNGNLTFNYAFQDVGIVLTVTPRITSNGYVTMDVSQTANDLQGFTNFNAPIVNQRQANTTVSVKDGETIILGGIIRSTVSSTVKKVPLLGDIPLLGQLFRSNDKNNVKTELLVFLTPRLVKNDADAKALREQGVEGLSGETKKLLEDWWKAKQAEEAAKAAPKKEGNDVPATKPRTGGNRP